MSKIDEVVVVKGVRRCGKSTLLINEMKRLVASGVAKEQSLVEYSIDTNHKKTFETLV